MRDKIAANISLEMLPFLSGFVSDGRSLILMKPIGSTLRGLTFASSAYSKEDFFFHWFFMPLCFPKDSLSLNYGTRMKAPDGTDGWRTDMPDLVPSLVNAVRRQALPNLLPVSTNAAVVKAIRRRVGWTFKINVHALEETACLLIQDRRFAEARKCLQQLTSLQSDPKQRDWGRVVAERGQKMLQKLDENPESALEEVLAWRDAAISELKLEKWK